MLSGSRSPEPCLSAKRQGPKIGTLLPVKGFVFRSVHHEGSITKKNEEKK